MEPFVGEIRIFGWNWAPKGWALCNGATLPVQQNQALAALIGATYGGNLPTTFNLPDLRGRTPINFGISPRSGLSYAVAETGGQEAVTLATSNLPPHTHGFGVVSATKGTLAPPKGSLAAQVGQSGTNATISIYGPSTPTPVPLAPASVTGAGGGAAHNNMQPFLVVNFCIATMGLWPQRQ